MPASWRCKSWLSAILLCRKNTSSLKSAWQKNLGPRIATWLCDRPRRGCEPLHSLETLVKSLQNAVFTNNLHQVIQAGSRSSAAAGEACRVHQDTGLYSEFLSDTLKSRSDRVGVEWLQSAQRLAQSLNPGFVFWNEVLFGGLSVKVDLVFKIKPSVSRKLSEHFKFPLAR